MALILNIDTAQERALVTLAQDGQLIGEAVNAMQKDHAGWIHGAIRRLMEAAQKQFADLDAVAVSAGPGSYTGLRVGMATAKGLCYTFNSPLITVPTFKLIASSARESEKIVYSSPIVYCPMIDARRMEVFTVMYNDALEEVSPPEAKILEADSFESWLTDNIVVFCGNGAVKWKTLCNHSNAVFSNEDYNMQTLAQIAEQQYSSGSFTDIAYAEPFYLKNVYMASK